MSKSAAALQSAVLDYEHLTSEIVWVMQNGHGTWIESITAMHKLNDERRHAIRRMVQHSTIAFE